MVPPPDDGAGTGSCPAPASWIDPGTQRRLDHAALIGRMAEKNVVLLGESHGVAAYHRWQLSMIAALHGRRPNMVLGFEAFPRRVQPVLDRWVRGELDPKAFLDAVDWAGIWGDGAEHYMPMFAFARLHRLPIVALNVDRTLTSRVAREGWANIPASDRAGLGDPAPADAAYRRALARVFLQHNRPGGDKARDEREADIDAALASEDFGHFMEAQLVWDRAMAEALATAGRRPGAPLVVGVMGQGHVASRHGVPRQLAALGVDDIAALLPRDRAEVCDGLPAGLADAVFVLGPDKETVTAPPMLGVRLETAAGRARIVEVSPGSVAAVAGLKPGDIVAQAAGRPVSRAADLVAIIHRQAPGTWLPLQIQRNGRLRRVVAKFP